MQQYHGSMIKVYCPQIEISIASYPHCTHIVRVNSMWVFSCLVCIKHIPLILPGVHLQVSDIQFHISLQERNCLG